MIDTHCHLTYKPLFEQLEKVLALASEAGVDRMITVGTSIDDAAKAVELAERIENVYAAAGVHPHYAHEHHDEQEVIKMVRRSANHPKVVAIGEMGLDRHYPDPPFGDQVRVFRWQLKVAKEFEYPIIIHNREATEQTISMIRESGIPGERFVFHCFTGNQEEHQAILELGAMVSFTGITTFRNASAIADCAARTPEDRIMVETDAPYLTPEPNRKVRPNQPCYVVDTARFIAARRHVSEQAFIDLVDSNAQRFFSL
jgi:TatD DNase family protein